MKKIRLRLWVRVVLFMLLGVSLFFGVCDTDSNMLLFIKNAICMLVAMLSFFLLVAYGGYDEQWIYRQLHIWNWKR